MMGTFVYTQLSTEQALGKHMKKGCMLGPEGLVGSPKDRTPPSIPSSPPLPGTRLVLKTCSLSQTGAPGNTCRILPPGASGGCMPHSASQPSCPGFTCTAWPPDFLSDDDSPSKESPPGPGPHSMAHLPPGSLHTPGPASPLHEHVDEAPRSSPRPPDTS